LNDNAIWVQILDSKYKIKNPNIFCCSEVGASPFLKGVLWAAQAAHMGVKWIVGNGKKVRFWEDIWIGNTSLAILFWPLYVINEQQGKIVSDVWDGVDLKLTFRRTVSESVMDLWWELLAMMDGFSFSEEEDHILWSYTSSGKYEVQSLYAMISFRGVVPNVC
jgi:hypothetical protein